MNYETLYNSIQAYSENTEQLFISNIPVFVIQAETRIYNSVNLASLRRNSTGTLTVNNKYLSLPNDWLATYSIAVIDSTGSYSYLLNKDVNFIREAYPDPTATGLPKYYSIFGSQYSVPNELSCILGPTPDSNYGVELHYFFYPASIVQGIITVSSLTTGGSLYTNGVYQNVPLTGGSGSGASGDFVITGGVVTNFTLQNGGNFYAVGDTLTVSPSYLGSGTGSGFSLSVTGINNSNGTSWLGDNYDPVLFYGAMREAMLFMKGEADLVKYYEDKYQEAMAELRRLGDGLDRGDAYRDGQLKLDVSGKGRA